MFSVNFKSRFWIIVILILLLFSLVVIRLINIQVVQGEYYRNESEKRLSKSVPVKAPRGEIFDRNMTPLIKNKMGFAIELHKIDATQSETNQVLLRLIRLAEEKGFAYSHSLPITPAPFAFDFPSSDEEEVQAKAAEWISSKELGEVCVTAEDVINKYREKYGISNGEYGDDEAYKLIGVLCEMENRMFSYNAPFTFANDIEMDVVSIIKENQADYRGVDIVVDSTREYAQGTLGAHLLGRVDVIYREEYNELKDQGYGMNDVIGKDGLEKVLEPYLKGKDGTSSVEYSIDGRLVRVIDSKPAESGNYAVLTLDADLQAAAEQALADGIAKTRAAGARAAKRQGADCDSGALVALDVNTGEVLAMASYPSYDPAKFTEEYNANMKNPANPMLNRTISGAYEPGSTFKMVTAIAGMQEGVVGPKEVIRDEGIYKYYAPSYTPACHIWTSSHTTHGNVTVSSALRESCNYFFYEVGRRVTIEKLNMYAKKFGLGQKTGIELAGEVSGILAGPEYRESIGSVWYPGDTIQAAIGQSDNMFTPIQMAVYVATLANGGTYYKPHLIKEIHSYNDKNDVTYFMPEAVEQININPAYLKEVVQGMRETITQGTARGQFSNSTVEAAGKTGTAEVPNGSDNGIFVGFAPYDNPKIAVAVVLENGAGYYVSDIGRIVMEAYLTPKDAAPEAGEQNE